MTEFITGVPGGGKTAFAVSRILKMNDENKYDYIYTNINQFKHDKFKNSRPLDFDELEEKIKELHLFYKTSITDEDGKKRKVTDDELIAKAKELEVFNSIFVIDECHNYFDKQVAHLVWWLSYHRHLHQDIYLITQNLSLVHSKYKAFAEVFYGAKPSLVRLRHHVLVYNKYSSSRMSKISKFGQVKLDTKKVKVFDYYKSGDNSKGQNALRKFIFIAVFFLLGFVGMIYAFTHQDTSSPKDIDPQTEKKQELEQSPKSREIKIKVKNPKNIEKTSNLDDLEKYKYISFYCVGKECKIENTYIPLKDLPFLAENTNSKLFDVEIQKNTKIVKSAFLASPMLLEIIRSVTNENEKKFSSKMPNTSNSSLKLPFM